MSIQLRQWYVLPIAMLFAVITGIAIFKIVFKSDETASQAEERRSTEIISDSKSSADFGEENRLVVLPKEKLAAAGIQIEQVKLGTLIHHHSVPGRVVYDETRHIELTTPADGIVTQVLVKPGDNVKATQVLAWLNSPEVGSARADVLQRKVEAELSQSLAERAARLKDNVTTLIYGLKQESKFEALRAQLTGRMLGDHREQLFGAYTRLMQAEKIVTNAAPLGETGALSGKVILAYETELMNARSALEAVCEQVELEVWKESQEAAATAADARRRMEIAKQHLSSLLLSESAIGSTEAMPDAAELGANENDLEHLSQVAIRAPFGGTIESLKFSARERVQANAPLFVLANTDALWISAEIRESDWTALSIEDGQTLMVGIPALGGISLPATVEFVGREVSLHTNSISIMARVDNKEGKLRPGLFVRVSVPVSEKKNALIIPLQAVQQHEGQSFVFMPESKNKFRRVDVTVGQEDEQEVEILQGLENKDRVVTQGSFVLKSELLLESEGE